MNGGSLMRGEGSSGDGSSGREWARACSSCRLAPCAVYCRADAAYLCAGCDARVHAANRLASRHERVWVCEVCQRAPAALTCRADAATLCAACDADVHSANPLARRHHRVPVLSIPRARLPTANLPPARFDGPLKADRAEIQPMGEDADDEESASWLFLNPVRSSNQSNSGFLFGGEVDEYLDLVEYNSGTENQNLEQKQKQKQNHCKNEEADHLVPVECLLPSEHQNQQQQQQQQQQNFPMEMEYEVSNTGFSYTASLNHSVCLSNMEAGVVPDTTTMTTDSNSHIRASKGTIDLFLGPSLQMPTQFSPMDREARVLRYREKRKMRKFEKIIRYASRKAYAETRPRIKGRFAKRSDVELEVDQMFATSVISDGSYSIVPSF